MAWVLPDIVTREIGLTQGQLRGMCRRGRLAHGYHWKVMERKTFYHLGRLQEWVDTGESESSAAESRSDTKSEEGGLANGSMRPHRSKPYRMRLDSANV